MFTSVSWSHSWCALQHHRTCKEWSHCITPPYCIFRSILFIIWTLDYHITSNNQEKKALSDLCLADDALQGLVELLPLATVGRGRKQLQELQQLHVQPRRGRPVIEILRRARLVQNLRRSRGGGGRGEGEILWNNSYLNFFIKTFIYGLQQYG